MTRQRPIPALVPLAAALCVAALTVAPARGSLLDSLTQALDRAGLFQGVQISGQNTLTLQQNLLEGSRSTFEGQRWDTGSFYRQTSLHLEGPIWREFGFRADLSASGWGPQHTRFVVGYVGTDTALYHGDLYLDVRGNEFAAFNKSMRGWQLDQRLRGYGTLRMFQSEEKGFTRNETFSGNNTSGPYFLTFTPVIEGSVRVKVDEEPMQLGQDYRLDYQTGELRFQPVSGPPRLVPSTSTIAVSYQSSGYYSSAGTVSGLRAELPASGQRGLVGLTYLRQDRPAVGQSDTAGYQEDLYQGSGTTGPFDTNYRPILADGASVVYRGETQTIGEALLVLVDNVQQIESVDYDAYRQIGRIIFRRAVPPTSLVRIQYYYSLGSRPPTGDLDIMGVDLSYRLSPELSLSGNWARSQGGSSGASGNALSTTLTYRRPRLNLSAELREMDPTYNFLDTVGFFRAESGLKWRMEWQPTDYLSVYDNYSSVSTNSGFSFGYSGWSGGLGTGTFGAQALTPEQTQADSGLQVRSRRHSYGLNLDLPDWPRLRFSADEMSNRGGSLGASSYGTQRLGLSHDFGAQLRSRLQWQWNDQSYRQTTAAAENGASGSRSEQGLLALSWNPSPQLAFSANLNTSQSTGSAVAAAADPRSSQSSAMQLAARWSPSSNLSLTLDRTMTQSDGAVSSGFYGGAPGSGGYYPPGGGGSYWPGPIAGALMVAQQEEDDSASTRYEDQSTNLTVSWQPLERLSLNAGLSQRKYLSGGGLGYLANSDQLTQNLYATYRLSPQWSLTSGFGLDRINFLDAGRGAISNQMYTAAVNYQPSQVPWSVSLALNRQTGSSPTYIGFGERQRYLMVDTELTDLSGQLRYRLGERSQLYATLGLSDFASGYAAFVKNNAEVGWQTRLSDTTRLDFGYRFLRNLAGSPTSPLFPGTTIGGQDYQSNTFALSVSTSFGGGGRSGAIRFAGPDSRSGAARMGAEGAFGPAFGGSYSGTGLLTFGGYQPGFGQPSRTVGGGLDEFGGERYSGQSRPGPYAPEGFPADLEGFGAPEHTTSPRPPAPDWTEPSTEERAEAGEAPPQPRPRPGHRELWQEGLSRWDDLPREEWW